ncbi:MAG: transketolase [Bacteroidota bacterium]|nr:transketolase [Candidatus Kapabacteria bacterium]MDW8219907.1 transketolase [Bacteroidota bacterium]
MAFENRRRHEHEYQELADIAKEIRRDIIRSLVVAGSGHSGGPLGLADIFAVLYFGGVMRYNPHDYQWSGRDRFVLSAGHLCPGLYATLANAGFFPKEELLTLRKLGSRLQGHPGLDMHLPGIETSTGSLGHGISIAVGMAMSDLLLDKTDRKVFALTGDGELQEGSVWEAAMSASHLRLSNFCWIIDNNDCQIDGRVKDVMSVYPIVDKCRAFGFDTIEIDGHSFADIYKGFDLFEHNHRKHTGKPTCIIAKTFMGKGVSFMHDNYEWHGKPPTKEQAEQALRELA